MANILRSPFKDVFIPTNTIFPDFVKEKLRPFSEQVAVIDSQNGKKHTYKDLLNLTDQLTNAFRNLNLKKGNVVSLCLPNCVEILPIALSITSFGGIFNTSNPNYTEEELIYQYRLVNSTNVITNVENAAKLLNVQQKCSTIKNVIVIDGQHKNCLSLESLLNNSKNNNSQGATQFERVDPKDVAFLFSSSGTTGMPKQIMLTHLNLVSNLSQLSPSQTPSGDASMFCPKRSDVVLSAFPYFHLAGLLNGLVWVLKEGGVSIILPKYETKTFIKCIETFKPNVIIAPPPVHVFLTKSPLAKQADLSSIKTVVNRAAPIGKSTVDALCERLNLPYVVNGYGMTELSTIGLIIPICEKSKGKRGSCGVPLPNSEVKVVDVETGATVGPNVHGQLCIRGLQITKGYLNNPTATNEAIDKEGWLLTGDICYYDNDGYFYIVDRIKEFLKVKGFQVAPAEIEHVILSHPAVADAAVVGILDEYAGELPLAYVVRKDDAKVTAEEIKSFVSKHLVKYKWLEGGVKFIDAIPKNPSGKILRRVLRDKARSEQQQQGRKNTDNKSKL